MELAFENIIYLAMGIVLTTIGVFVNYIAAAAKERHKERLTMSALRQELIEEAQLNITKLNGLTAAIPMVEEAGGVPVYLPHRMTLTALHQAISDAQLRLFPTLTQLHWRSVVEICETFNKFVDNTELLAIICLLHPDGLKIVRHRHQQLAAQAKDSREAIEQILSNITPP